MTAPVSLYEYEAVIDSIFDGDTIRASISLGFGIWKRNEPLRLFGINAPEMRNETLEQGRISRDALRDRVLGKRVWLRTIKPSVETVPGLDKREKYGRFLAVLWDDDGNVNDWLVESGFAESYMTGAAV